MPSQPAGHQLSIAVALRQTAIFDAVRDLTANGLESIVGAFVDFAEFLTGAGDAAFHDLARKRITCRQIDLIADFQMAAAIRDRGNPCATLDAGLRLCLAGIQFTTKKSLVGRTDI